MDIKSSYNDQEVLFRTFELQKIEGIGSNSLWKMLGHVRSEHNIPLEQIPQNMGVITELIRKIPEEKLKLLIGIKRAELMLSYWKNRRESKIRDAFLRMLDKNITYCPFYKQEFPTKLLWIPNPPFGIFHIGPLPSPMQKQIAVVGARMCSMYGRHIAHIYATELARAGAGIISGLARGIDEIAQKTALSEEGYSAAVMGCGVDICYPEENRKTYDELIKKGCIISEFCPQTVPRQQNFPMRNRIISGLSDALLVIEARQKSGTLITADMALEQGKEVFAIPGRVDEALSFGCNNLIYQGAGMVISPAQLLEELGIQNERIQNKSNEKNNNNKPSIILDKTENNTQIETIIMSSIDIKPVLLDEIYENVKYTMQTQLNMNVFKNEVLKLELGNYIQIKNGFAWKIQ